MVGQLCSDGRVHRGVVSCESRQHYPGLHASPKLITPWDYALGSNWTDMAACLESFSNITNTAQRKVFL